MAATELTNRPEAETRVQELSDKVNRQVSDILEQARRTERVAKPVLAYRVPSAGVRYYF